MKRVLIGLAIVSLGLLLGTIGTGWFIWRANARLRDSAWLKSASPAEIRRAAHTVLATPIGDHHSAAMTLRYDGDASSIPYLIGSLRWMGDTTPEKPYMVCTKSCALDALKKITGHSAGHNHSDWAAWWAETGSRIPPDHFPLKEAPDTPPKP